MVAGTTIMRTMVASSATATASPMPNILISGDSPRTNEAKTLIMMSAAAVMTRAETAMPCTMLPVGSPEASQSSRTRERMNTS